jgi:hypothetical protein
VNPEGADAVTEPARGSTTGAAAVKAGGRGRNWGAPAVTEGRGGAGARCGTTVTEGDGEEGRAGAAVSDGCGEAGATGSPAVTAAETWPAIGSAFRGDWVSAGAGGIAAGTWPARMLVDAPRPRPAVSPDAGPSPGRTAAATTSPPATTAAPIHALVMILDIRLAPNRMDPS